MILKIENLEYPITTFTSYPTSDIKEPLILDKKKIYYFAKRMISNPIINEQQLFEEYNQIQKKYNQKIEIIRTDETVIYNNLKFETIYIEVTNNVSIFNIVFSE